MMEINMVLYQCSMCGVTFAMTRDFRDRMKSCHKTFYCPEGHGQYYIEKSEVEKLREQCSKQKEEIVRLKRESKKLAGK